MLINKTLDIHVCEHHNTIHNYKYMELKNMLYPTFIKNKYVFHVLKEHKVLKRRPQELWFWTAFKYISNKHTCPFLCLEKTQKMIQLLRSINLVKKFIITERKKNKYSWSHIWLHKTLWSTVWISCYFVIRIINRLINV